MNIRARIEHVGMNMALTMFLLLCTMSAVNGTLDIVTAARNFLFVVLGVVGLLVAGELASIQRMRLAGRKKRVLFIAEYLLIAFSLVLLFAGMLELNMLTALSRWD